MQIGFEWIMYRDVLGRKNGKHQLVSFARLDFKHWISAMVSEINLVKRDQSLLCWNPSRLRCV